MKVRVIIKPKSRVPDSEGETVLQVLNAAGYSDVKSVQVGKVIEMNIDGADETTFEARVSRLCKAGLIDEYKEDYELQPVEEE